MKAGQWGNARNKNAGAAGNVSGRFRSGGESAYQNSSVLSMVRASVAEHKEAYGDTAMLDTTDVDDVAVRLTRRVLDTVNDLPLLEKAILIVMAFTAANEDGERVFPKLATLARQVGCSERAIRNGLHRLEHRYGRIEQVKSPRKHSPAEWKVKVPDEAGAATAIESGTTFRSEMNDVPVREEPRSGLGRNDVPVFLLKKDLLKDSTK